MRTGDTVRGASKLRECVGVAGLPGIPFDGSALLAGLQAAVDLAMYWQEPDAEDRGFAGEAAREALRPLDVSKSRRHDWWRVTGWAGRWLIPDYAAVAADWDAVHVTVAGYLTTAGIAIPVGDGARTMLAGWDPDATWWITDVLSFTSPPQDWRKDDQALLGWTQAPQL